jgi:hypothetical protein
MHSRKVDRKTLESVLGTIDDEPGSKRYVTFFKTLYLNNDAFKFPITLYESQGAWKLFHEAHDLAMDVLGEEGASREDYEAIMLRPLKTYVLKLERRASGVFVTRDDALVDISDEDEPERGRSCCNFSPLAQVKFTEAAPESGQTCHTTSTIRSQDVEEDVTFPVEEMEKMAVGDTTSGS